MYRSLPQNQLFHPFSQENPLQTGTGLGLAIVNSIVQSDSVRGKLDVWSEENVGTEIKVCFKAVIADDESGPPAAEMTPIRAPDSEEPVTVSLHGFNPKHRGLLLLESTLRTYLGSWWGFNVLPNDQAWGRIVILNEDYSPVIAATERRDTSHPFIIMAEARGNPDVLAAASDYDNIGGFCRALYKPVGPSKLWALIKLCVHTIHFSTPPFSTNGVDSDVDVESISARMQRRKSEDGMYAIKRPRMMPRSMTASPVIPPWPHSISERDSVGRPLSRALDEEVNDESCSTILVGDGGTLLKSSVGSIESRKQRFRVLVVEDNNILRSLLYVFILFIPTVRSLDVRSVKWLTNKGYDLRDAVDGRDGVEVFKSDGPFEYDIHLCHVHKLIATQCRSS